MLALPSIYHSYWVSLFSVHQSLSVEISDGNIDLNDIFKDQNSNEKNSSTTHQVNYWFKIVFSLKLCSLFRCYLFKSCLHFVSNTCWVYYSSITKHYNEIGNKGMVIIWVSMPAWSPAVLCRIIWILFLISSCSVFSVHCTIDNHREPMHFKYWYTKSFISRLR